MKKLFIILIAFFSFVSVFATNIDYVYAEGGKGHRTTNDKNELNPTTTPTTDLDTIISDTTITTTTPTTTTSQETTTSSETEEVESPTWLDTNSNKVSCGPISSMSKSIPKTSSIVVLFLEVLTPALLVIFGMLDFYKAVASGVEENMKKNKNAFFNRIVAAMIVFLIIALTKLLVSTVSSAQGADSKGITSCINCFINNKCGGAS